MKFYNIMLFFFVFNLSLGVVNQMGMFDTSYEKLDKGVVNEEAIESQSEKASNVHSEQGLFGDLNYLVQQVRLVISGVFLFVKAFGNAIYVRPMLSNIFCSGIDCSQGLNSVINAITVLTELTYFVGLVQLITGRNIKSIQ